MGDLLRFYPRGYEVYEAPVPISEIEEGNVFAVTGMISGAVKTGGSRAMQVTTLCIKDESASLKVIWFRMPFLKNSLRSGSWTCRSKKGWIGDGASGNFFAFFQV